MDQEILRRERIFSGQYLRLERRTVRLPDGREAPREIVMARAAVAVLPIAADGTTYFVRQFRPAVERTLLEIPAGVVDAGETAEQAVRRELREEAGVAAGEVRHLLDYYHAEGYSTGIMHVYLALDVRDAGGPQPEDGEYLELVTMPFEEAHRRVLAGEFLDSKSMLTVLRARMLRDEGVIRFG